MIRHRVNERIDVIELSNKTYKLRHLKIENIEEFEPIRKISADEIYRKYGSGKEKFSKYQKTNVCLLVIGIIVGLIVGILQIL